MARRTIAQMEQEIAALKEAYEAEVSTLRSQVAEAEKQREDIIRALMTEADERGWCSEFESFIQDNGIEVPEDALWEWDVTVSLSGVSGMEVRAGDLVITPSTMEVTGKVRSLVNPEDEWDSWDGIDSDKVEALLRSAGYHGVTFTGFTVESAERVRS